LPASWRIIIWRDFPAPLDASGHVGDASDAAGASAVPAPPRSRKIRAFARPLWFSLANAGIERAVLAFRCPYLVAVITPK
jgi:hypothetical protein